MAHGTESEEFRLVSGARSGLKREFAFALKNQSDLTSSMMGRTRSKKVQNNENPSSKRFMTDVAAADVKEEAEIDLIVDEKVQIDLVKSEIVKESTCLDESKPDLAETPILNEQDRDLTNNGAKPHQEEEEEGKAETPVVIDANVEKQPGRRFTRSLLKPKAEPMEISPVPTTSSGSTVVSEEVCKNELNAPDIVSPLKTPSGIRLEMKMSKKIALKKVPGNVKELLATGLLEGFPVKYIYRSKKNGLRGIIKDGGILCSCATCKGCQVVSANNFEKHAGSLYKHPSDNIYLENGNNLRQVLNACKAASCETFEESVKRTISSRGTQFNFCMNCREPLSGSGTTKTAPFCDMCLATKEPLASPSHTILSNPRLSKPVPTPKSSGSASDRASSKTKSKGKLTRKDLRLHKLVFEEDGLPDGTELGYYVRGKKLLEGHKMGVGIFCNCCQTEVSPSQFEAHAGYASRRKPYLNIYTSNGVSLHELSVSLSRGRKSSTNDNDDLCSYCADFGDLLCCDTCPRAFHLDCVGLDDIPEDKWYCNYCTNMFEREKCCGYNANAKAAGRVEGVDVIGQIFKRCIRIVETSGTEVGGCVLCRHHGFSKAFGPSTVILCDQCEKEFHVGCLKSHNMADLKELPEGMWFCCTECNRIHTAMQKLVSHGPEKLPESLLKSIKKKQEENCPNNGADVDVRWSVLSGKMATLESKSLLSKAVSIFHDQFDPIHDTKTRQDLIPAMVYGRNVKDQDFGGMYCAVLTVNSVVVSAGIIRIFGQDMAEIPLVATSSDNQGRGYFQSLFACIERLLGFLNVKTIVLPSAPESKAIWTDKFGFTTTSQDQLNEYKNSGQMMIFQGTSLLQKPVPKCRIVGKSTEGS